MTDTIDPYAKSTTGTTIIAIIYDKGILLGSDTQSNSGIWKQSRFEDKF